MEFNATLLVSSISFILFVIIMNQILYKPVMAIMQKRQEYINNNKIAADEHGKHAQELLKDKDKKIGETRKKSRDIVAAKTEAIKREKTEVINGKKAEMSDFVDTQKEDLANQKQDAYDRLKGSVADLANNITKTLIGTGISFEPLNEAEVEEVIRNNA